MSDSESCVAVPLCALCAFDSASPPALRYNSHICVGLRALCGCAPVCSVCSTPHHHARLTHLCRFQTLVWLCACLLAVVNPCCVCSTTPVAVCAASHASVSDSEPCVAVPCDPCCCLRCSCANIAACSSSCSLHPSSTVRTMTTSSALGSDYVYTHTHTQWSHICSNI